MADRKEIASFQAGYTGNEWSFGVQFASGIGIESLTKLRPRYRPRPRYRRRRQTGAV